MRKLFSLMVWSLYFLPPLAVTGYCDLSYTIQRASPTDSDPLAQGMNSSGEVIGYTVYPTIGDPTGWLFSNGTVTQMGLTGPGYQVGSTSFSEALLLNNAGAVAGISELLDQTGQSDGSDVWFYNGTSTQLIGLTGSLYTETSQQGTFRTNQLVGNMNSSGEVIGYADRIENGYGLGTDSWIYNGITTQQIGLVGGGYDYDVAGMTDESSQPVQINDAGEVIGTSQRYAPLGGGQDSWLYNGSTNIQVGLTGGNWSYPAAEGGTFQSSTPLELNDAGQVVGSSSRYNSSGTSLGTDTWIYSAGTTQQIGLVGSAYGYSTGTGTYESSRIIQMNGAGDVIGTSLRYGTTGTTLGEDAWVYSGGVTRAIGLTGPVYGYQSTGGTYEQSALLEINNAGDVAGITLRTNGNLGQDVWFWDGSATQQIGLTGAGFSYSTTNGTYEDSTTVAMNDSGEVIGTSERYSSTGASLGSSGWIFNPLTDSTLELDIGSSSSGYSDTNPLMITDSGAVLGTYELYEGATAIGVRDFIYTPLDGIEDLGSLVAGGLASSKWQYLDGFFTSASALGETPSDGPMYILTQGPNGIGTGVALLTAVVPEPQYLLILPAIIALGALSRNGRRQCG